MADRSPTRSWEVRCPIPSCGRVMGTTDGHRLYLGACMCARTVTLHCTSLGCSGRVTWRPVLGPGTGDGTGPQG